MDRHLAAIKANETRKAMSVIENLFCKDSEAAYTDNEIVAETGMPRSLVAKALERLADKGVFTHAVDEATGRWLCKFSDLQDHSPRNEEVEARLKARKETLQKVQDGIDATILSFFAEDQPFARTAEDLHAQLASVADMVGRKPSLGEVTASLKRLVKAGEIRCIGKLYCNRTYCESPESYHASEAIDEWLEKHRPFTYAETEGVTGTLVYRYTEHTLCGKTFIVRKLADQAGKVRGWDVFVPVEQSNSVDATIAALGEYITPKAA